MDFKSNNDSLFGARNENSVLFSLEDLNSIDNDSNSGNAGSGFGSSGDASGLINLDMLSKMGSSAGSGGDDDESIGGVAMESMVFNQVVTKQTKRNYALIFGICAVLLIAAGVGAWFMISSSDEAKEQKEREAQEAMAAAEASEEANKAKERELMELRAQLEEMKKKGDANAADKARLEAMLQKLEDEDMQAKVAGDDDDDKKGSSRRSSGSSTAKAGGSAPATKSSGGSKPDPAKIKQSLGEAAAKAKKCGKNGNLLVQMNINSSGSAKSVKGISGTFKGSATEKCIITVIERHQFPSFSGNAIPVKYNFKL